jgi:DEAD/DEAH box helicase domain-containing protein
VLSLVPLGWAIESSCAPLVRFVTRGRSPRTMSNRTLDEIVGLTLADAGFETTATRCLPGGVARYAAVPRELNSRLAGHLAAMFAKGLFLHQAAALRTFAGGSDVCISTTTASGKSLVFMAAAANLLLTHPTKRVLVLYPAKALIEDQLPRWNELLGAFGFRAALIHGGVPLASRERVLQTAEVLLMTPDVLHAWVMSSLPRQTVSRFVENIALVVLDEAHAYSGAFGTNMAYLIRRLRRVAGEFRVISATATLDRPADFIETLVGTRPVTIDHSEDASARSPKTIHLVAPRAPRDLGGVAKLLMGLASSIPGRFIAFCDSRKLAEQLVRIAHRTLLAELKKIETGDSPIDPDEGEFRPDLAERLENTILPYRAGYEQEDRERIQRALSTGMLKGVVSTSALELGIDIGEIEVVVLVGAPTSAQAFWQRLGRAGRRATGACIILDVDGVVSARIDGLDGYLARPVEPNRLYLANRYIQYAHAVCAAIELSEPVRQENDALRSLPEGFARALANELDPVEALPQDLHALKQRAQASPHHSFPLRSGIEESFRVIGPFDRRMGELTMQYVVREAYPGAIYYYLGRPFRVFQFEPSKRRLRVRSEKAWTTEPISHVKCFPDFIDGRLNVRSNGGAFAVEVEMQVSERVLGFVERRGAAQPEQHLYEPGSGYWQRPVNRFFETTGVCLYFPEIDPVPPGLGAILREAFSAEFGIQSGDLGAGEFHSRRLPDGKEGPARGICIFDSTSGSLRLTELLVDNLGAVLDGAIALAGHQGAPNPIVSALRNLRANAASLQSSSGAVAGPESAEVTDGDWVRVIASGESAMIGVNGHAREVVVRGWRYTPNGLMYELENRSCREMVPATQVTPFRGQTRTLLVNLVTGEEREAA